ncbi:protein tyrosine phosphatase [Erwinia sp. JUb26]|uniref:arsenate reductase/protein-tyrosine-phosphatase family protein n=1 Tax=Erwinia sp. JUb26 TaxID=2485126 RepID=UPI002712109C|nr:protein tyrosine phosphatase [Erwinia sp. JUb26]
MFNSILVVCTGNICRSPIAERLLKIKLPNKVIESAGTGALVEHPADDSAIAVSQKHNLSLDGHSGQKFTAKLAMKYDLILVMDKGHIEKISQIYPQARGKTMLLGYWLNEMEIPDPYRKSLEAFEYVYQLIDQACDSWVEKLNV